MQCSSGTAPFLNYCMLFRLTSTSLVSIVQFPGLVVRKSRMLKSSKHDFKALKKLAASMAMFLSIITVNSPLALTISVSSAYLFMPTTVFRQTIPGSAQKLVGELSS